MYSLFITLIKLNNYSNYGGKMRKMVPFCHARWVRWRCVWCSPWLAWTFSLFGKSAEKQNSSTCYYRSHKVTSNRLCNLHFTRCGPRHHTKSKLNHCLQVYKQTWLHSRFSFHLSLISLSSLLLLFETRCALSFKCYRAWEIWHFCLTHRISEKRAHYRTLKGHKQQEI